jgi:lipopolysaccharide transport system ATP-binding protein
LWYGVKDIAKEAFGLSSGHDRLRPEEFWAVNDVSFEVKRGECLGLIGRNGAGKTTLLKMLNGLIKPDKGRIEMRGRVGALIALGAGFNPILTGRENIYVNGSVLGLTKQEVGEKIEEIIDFAEIGDFIDSPVQNYSSGMQIRLGFAVASTLKPDVLILDEVLAVGDANFQSKCFQRIGKIVESAAVIFVSHYAYQIKKMCDRVILLDHGIMVEDGEAGKVLETYQNSQPLQIRESLILRGDDVREVAIENITTKVSTGEFLEFDLIISMEKKAQCAQSYLNLVDGADIVHAQVVIPDLERLIPYGHNRYHIKIGPLFLATGRYSGNFMLYGSGGKTTLAHLRHCFNFEFLGVPNLGPVYYPPSTVTPLRHQDKLSRKLLNE